MKSYFTLPLGIDLGWAEGASERDAALQPIADRYSGAFSTALSRRAESAMGRLRSAGRDPQADIPATIGIFRGCVVPGGDDQVTLVWRANWGAGNGHGSYCGTDPVGDFVRIATSPRYWLEGRFLGRKRRSRSRPLLYRRHRCNGRYAFRPCVDTLGPVRVHSGVYLCGDRGALPKQIRRRFGLWRGGLGPLFKVHRTALRLV